jgi:hypothetical protein
MAAPLATSIIAMMLVTSTDLLNRRMVSVHLQANIATGRNFVSCIVNGEEEDAIEEKRMCK